MQQSSPSRFGIVSIISAVIILILIMVLAIFSFLVQPAEPEAVVVYENISEAVNPSAVDPALAIALLAGVSDEDVIEQAISKSRPGTALATVVYSPQLDPNIAAGDLLLLGDKFAELQDTSRASLCYQMAGTMATLSPDLSDTLRADIFLQAGIGLKELGEPVLAKVYLDQAFLVAKESAYLQAAYRFSVLDALRQVYLQLGLNDLARESQTFSLDPGRLQALPETPLALPIDPQLAIPLEVQQAEADRWRAAQRVATELVELGGEVRPDTLLALQRALLIEDEQKTVFFNDRLSAEQQRSSQVALVQAKIVWQSIKYRVAIGSFGLSIVPLWEEQAQQIRADLNESYTELYRLYSDIIVAIPIAADIDRATEEAIRRQLLAGLMGQYSDYPSEQLRAQLLSASARLIETQPSTELRVSYLAVDTTNYYTLISDDEVLNP